MNPILSSAGWRRRAAADFRTAAERIAEHERRIRFALSEFPLRSVEREYNKAMPYRSGQTLTDAIVNEELLPALAQAQAR